MASRRFVDKGRYPNAADEDARTELWRRRQVEDVIRNDPTSAKLKRYLRDGIPDAMRGEMWKLLLHVERLDDADKNYEAALERLANGNPELVDVLAAKTRVSIPSNHALNEDGLRVLVRLLLIIRRDYPHVFFPGLPSLATILLHHMDENDALACLHVMVSASASTHDRRKLAAKDIIQARYMRFGPWAFFPTVRSEARMMSAIFSDLLFTLVSRKIAANMRKISTKPEGALAHVYEQWFCSFFLEIYDLQTVFRIFDIYLVECYKTLFRFALAPFFGQEGPEIDANDDSLDSQSTFARSSKSSAIQFQRYRRSQKKTTEMLLCSADTSENFGKALRVIARHLCQGASSSSLLQTAAYATSFSRKQVMALREARIAQAPEGDASASLPSSMLVSPAGSILGNYDPLPLNTEIIHLPSISPPLSLFTPNEFLWLWSWIPPRFHIYSLKRIFNSRVDGISLATFYRACDPYEKTLLFIRTRATGEHPSVTIGAFCSQSWHERSKHTFFGTGETFVFSNFPSPRICLWAALKTQQGEHGRSDPLFHSSLKHSKGNEIADHKVDKDTSARPVSPILSDTITTSQLSLPKPSKHQRTKSDAPPSSGSLAATQDMMAMIHGKLGSNGNTTNGNGNDQKNMNGLHHSNSSCEDQNDDTRSVNGKDIAILCVDPPPRYDDQNGRSDVHHLDSDREHSSGPRKTHTIQTGLFPKDASSRQRSTTGGPQTTISEKTMEVKLTPPLPAPEDSSKPAHEVPQLFMTATYDHFGIGGGDSFAISVTSTVTGLKGMSGTSTTFENEPLTPTKTFDIAEMEVYIFH